MALPSISLAVVGASYPNPCGPSRRFELSICQPGEAIELRPEPKNKHDENAVAVFSARGVQLGYVTAERAPWIGTCIRRGEEVCAIFQQQTQWGAVIRVSFDGSVPVIPPQFPAKAAEEEYFDAPDLDFYPDEEWPD